METAAKPEYGTPEWNAYYSSAAKAKRSRANARRVRLEMPDYDRDAYNRGYRSMNLEGGDARGESSEWYDGYMDSATGREKWHRPLCGDRHHNGPGGCGQA